MYVSMLRWLGSGKVAGLGSSTWALVEAPGAACSASEAPNTSATQLRAPQHCHSVEATSATQ